MNSLETSRLRKRPSNYVENNVTVTVSSCPEPGTFSWLEGALRAWDIRKGKGEFVDNFLTMGVTKKGR
jgi:hypothetical protein